MSLGNICILKYLLEWTPTNITLNINICFPVELIHPFFPPVLTYFSFITIGLYSLFLLIQLCSNLYVSEVKWKVCLSAGIIFSFINTKQRYSEKLMLRIFGLLICISRLLLSRIKCHLPRLILLWFLIRI